ncbi:hypothetical protein VTK26DRAFT_4448 [Humicola hyalothermophila]
MSGRRRIMWPPWVPSTFPGKGEACLYTENYEKKRAYQAVWELLREAAAAAGGEAGGEEGENACGVGPSTAAQVKAGAGVQVGNAVVTGGVSGLMAAGAVLGAIAWPGVVALLMV